MPLRRWLTGHGLPAWWSWVVLVLFTAVSVGLNTMIATRTSQRAIEADRRARTETAQSSLAALCDAVRSQEAVFREAQSEVGQNAARSWHALGVKYGCYKE